MHISVHTICIVKTLRCTFMLGLPPFPIMEGLDSVPEKSLKFQLREWGP